MAYGKEMRGAALNKSSVQTEKQSQKERKNGEKI